MGSLVSLLGGLSLVSGLYWWFTARAVWRTAARLPTIGALPNPTLPRWPKISLVVPARDEGQEIEAALRARLADGYPALEVIVVDDRSSDDTGAIADRIAASDPRVRVVHLDALPEGWLGKLHAMQRGVEAARGDYLLFSDADVHWQPGTLQRLICQCELQRLDHVAVLPEFWSSGLALDAAVAAFLRVLVLVGRPWLAADPASAAAFGVGAFNLVRRAAFERTGGFEWLRLEVADDVALGAMMKQHGGRSAVFLGRGRVGLHAYRTLAAFARSAEKAAVFFEFSAVRGALGAALVLALELGSLAALVAGEGLTRGLGALGVALALAASAGLARALGLRVAPALLVPLGALLCAWASGRAALLGARQGGLRWRSTFYPAALLREGRRFRFGGGPVDVGMPQGTWSEAHVPAAGELRAPARGRG